MTTAAEVQSYFRSHYAGGGWWYIDKFKPAIALVGAERDSQKLNYESTKNWSNGSTHTLGLYGELVFSLETGLKMDLTLRKAGDGGRDFVYDGKTYAVKTTQYWQDPHLKEYPNPKRWCDFYILCAVDIRSSMAMVSGWATQDEMRFARKSNYGNGPMLSIACSNMGADRQFIPPELPRTRQLLHILETQGL